MWTQSASSEVDHSIVVVSSLAARVAEKGAVPVSRVFRQETAPPATRTHVEDAPSSPIPPLRRVDPPRRPRPFPATQTTTPRRTRARDPAYFHSANPTFFPCPPWQAVQSSICPGRGRLKRPVHLRFALAKSLFNRPVILPFRHRHVPATMEAFQGSSGSLSHPFRYLCRLPFQPHRRNGKLELLSSFIALLSSSLLFPFLTSP